MKKIISTLCVLALAFFAVSCGDSSSQSDYVAFRLTSPTDVTTDYGFTAGFTDTGFDQIPAAVHMTGGIRLFIYASDAPRTCESGNFIIFDVDGMTPDTYPAIYFRAMVPDIGASGRAYTISVTFTEIGDVGGRVSGTFSGTINFVTDTYNIEGSFEVKRYADDSLPCG